MAFVWAFAQVIAHSLAGSVGGGTTLMAQDAFYIYRNDGDFNGFFFDEVISMSYSKIDPQGVEHEEYVIQEIETADSIYRIPLCAIDSIGFQQPEIKINPRVRIIERCGLKQYMGWVKNSDDQVVVDFHDVPENLKPKVGDVLIYLCTDDEYLPFIYTERGFSCIVDKVQTYDNVTNVEGHYVTDPGEVFEQFITVEDITVDPEGHVRRRLAGWHPEKAPRRTETPEVTLLDFDFTVSREWEPTDNSKIAIEAKLGVKYKLRATYDISWTKFYAKLTRTLTTSVEPAVTIGYKGDFMKELEDLVELPPIIFPAACPVFGINPYPTLFLHAWGEFETKMTLPKAELNIAEDIIFDTGRLFPIDYSMYPAHSEDKHDEPIFDVGNTSVKFAGHVQAGVKVGCDVGTAKWMQKIIKGNVGFNAYIGPQVDGQIEFQTDWLNNAEMNLYDMLSRAEVDVSLLSVNVGAMATAKALWGEEQHKTFLTKDWKFLRDTLLLVPRFRDWGAVSPTYADNGHKVTLAIHTNPKKLFYLNDLSIGIYEPPSDKGDDYTAQDMIIVKRVGNWSYSPYDWKKYEYTLTEDDIKGLKGTKRYSVFPLVTWLGNGPYPAFVSSDVFICPWTMELKSKELHFSADGGEASVEFTTNCLKEHIQLEGFDTLATEYSYTWIKNARLEVINEEKGQYRAVFKALPNTTLWDRKILKGPSIVFTNSYGGRDCFELDAYQAPNNLSNFEVVADVRTEGHGERSDIGTDYEHWGVGFKHQVTATRLGNDIISVQGEYTTIDSYDNTPVKYFITFEIKKIVETEPDTGREIVRSAVTNGNIRNSWEGGVRSGSYARALFDWEEVLNVYPNTTGIGTLISSTYHRVYRWDNGSIIWTATYESDGSESDGSSKVIMFFYIDGVERPR